MEDKGMNSSGSLALFIVVSMSLWNFALPRLTTAQDSTFFAVGECECPFDLEDREFRIDRFTCMTVTIAGVSTSSFDDLYATVSATPGQRPIIIYFVQNRIPEVGDTWLMGPLKLNDRIHFRIFSRILDERTSCYPYRPGRVTSTGTNRWRIEFEDWCDFDWDDIVLDISYEDALPTINILRPADRMSFVSDDATTYRVHATARALDAYGDDLSHTIYWFVTSSPISGWCTPFVRYGSPVFDFTATFQPRKSRGFGPLEYRIYATARPNFIPITDIHRLKQDDIDTVRQQYIDYHLRLPYKSRFRFLDRHVEIHPEGILFEVFYGTRPCYELWAGVPNATFGISSGFRSPDYNRIRRIRGKPHSMHQYGLAIDVDYGDYHEPGWKDDSKAIVDCVNALRYAHIRPIEHADRNYNHVHIQYYTYEDMPYVER